METLKFRGAIGECDNTLLADNGDDNYIDNRSVPNEESDPYEYYSRISVLFAPEGLPGADSYEGERRPRIGYPGFVCSNLGEPR